MGKEAKRVSGQSVSLYVYKKVFYIGKVHIMADERQLAILASGKALWNKWRRDYSEIRAFEPDLHGADLHGLDLRGIDFHGADLTEANLQDADLYGADLHLADIRNANMRGANLADADCSHTLLNWTDLRDAILRRTNLHTSDLRNAKLLGADLEGALLNEARRDVVQSHEVKLPDITTEREIVASGKKA